MRVLNVVVVLLVFGLVGAVGTANAQAPEPALVVVQLDTLEVEPQRPGKSGTWDSSEEKSGNNCGLLAGAVSFLATPAAGGVTNVLCNAASSGKQRQKDPRAPDLVIRLTTGAGESFHTPVARDMYSHDFGYRVLIPLAAIPRHGLKLAVIDQDGDQAIDGELLGSFRVRREELLDGKLHVLKKGSVRSLELSASPYVHAESSKDFVAKAGEGLTATKYSVVAGQMIEVRASGQVDVTSFGNDPVSAAGFPKGKRAYNLPMEPFKSGPHAAAVTLVAADSTAIGGIVAGECSRFVAQFTGSVVLGVNDSDHTNNNGELNFRVRTLEPSAKDWAMPGKRLPCGKPEKLSNADIAAGMAKVRGAIASCGNALATSATVKVKIKVSGEGSVSSAIATGGTPPLHECVTSAVKKAQFTPSEIGASLTYPFVFKPQLAKTLARVRAKYMAGIKRCHQRVLRVDPRSQGQVTIAITVGPTGRVAKATVRGFDPTVDSCIKSQATKWRFEAPKKDGKPTSVDYEIPLLLKPGS
jgi:hypothetical protein